MKKDSKKYEDSLRELQDNKKHNNIQIIGISEGEEKEQGRETLFEKMTDNLLNLEKEKNHASTGSTESPSQDEPKEANSKTYHN